MNLPAPVVSEAFSRDLPGELDFDAIAAPRRLDSPVRATVWEAASDLAWFWNSNVDRALEQVTLADDYADLVARLVESASLAAGDRVVLSAREPRRRREAFLRALPPGVATVDWPAGDDLRPLLDARTRMVVMSKACAVTGELIEVVPLSQLLSGTGILLVVEASHFVAHGSLDVRRFRCDALLFAADELFGAEGAALWMRRPRFAVRPPVSERTAASLAAVVRYVEELGTGGTAVVAPPSDRFGRREAMRRGMQGIRQEERVLCRRLLSGLRRFKEIRVLGEEDPWRSAQRTPAVTFVAEDNAALADRLGKQGIRVEFGDCGSPGVLHSHGVPPGRGAIRVSLAHYHLAADIDRFLSALRDAL